MTDQPKLTLYLPIGLISSEKLLILTNFLVPDQLAVEFVYAAVLVPDPDKSTHYNLADINIGNISFDSSDGRNSIESSLRGSLSSSLDFQAKKQRREDKRKKSEFDRNQNLNKVLDKQKLEKAGKHEEEFVETDIEAVKSQKPVLLLANGQHVVNFSTIVLTILRNCTLKYAKLRVEENETTKFRNYMLYIDRKVDYNVNKILYELYSSTKNKCQSQFNRIDKFLKILLHNLDYFESFVFVKDSYIFGEDFSVVDLMLLGSLSRMFVLFFDERIREGCLNNTTKWLKSFIEIEEVRMVYGDFTFCVKNYLLFLENTPEKNLKNSKLIEKKYDQEFSLENLKICLKRLIKLKHTQTMNEESRKKGWSTQTIESNSHKPKHQRHNTNSSSIDMYKDSDKITDLDTLRQKIELTLLNNINTDEYSVWLFDYIKEADDQMNFEDDNSSQSIEEQLFKFYQDMLVDMENNEMSMVGYMIIYSNCEELNKEEEFIDDFEICKKHSPNIFLNKNLKGLIVKKGQNALKFMTSYESLDQIILTKVKSKEQVDTLKDLVYSKGTFEMEKAYKEVAI